jgi:surfactin synthase thioesterase subunit
VPTGAKRLLHAFTPRGKPRVRLVCFPHAGGSIASFHGWPARLPGVAVYGAELPGHGSRIAEKPLWDMDSLLAQAVPEIVGLGAEPVMLWGHSMGAVLAHAVARRLADRDPAALLVAGRDAPWAPSFLPQFHVLSDTDLWRSVIHFGGVPPAIADCADVRELIIPVLRADLAMVETFRAESSPALNCPVHVFTGRDDGLVSEAGLSAWSGASRVPTRWHEFPGGHFFIWDNGGGPVLSTIREVVHTALSRYGAWSSPRRAVG